MVVHVQLGARSRHNLGTIWHTSFFCPQVFDTISAPDLQSALHFLNIDSKIKALSMGSQGGSGGKPLMIIRQAKTSHLATRENKGGGGLEAGPKNVSSVVTEIR